MIFKTLKGRDANVICYKYSIRWEEKSRSIFQTEIKHKLKEYWNADQVCEEFPMAGSKLKFDFFNVTRKIVVEADGKQHDTYNEFFHRGNRGNFLESVKRDNRKDKFCELNEIILIRISHNTKWEKISHLL